MLSAMAKAKARSGAGKVSQGPCPACGNRPGSTYESGRDYQRALIAQWLRKRFESKTLSGDIESGQPEEWLRQRPGGAK